MLNVKELSEFISIRTIAGNESDNNRGINYITKTLHSLGFDCELKGSSPHYQPVIIAKRIHNESANRIVLYGHYDVEKIRKSDKWDTPPFEMIEKEDRFYCRGIADNKGILYIRLQAVKEMIKNNEPVPNILWIIQGEEEVDGRTPFEVIPDEVSAYRGQVYVEETGVHQKGKPVLFYLPDNEKKPEFLDTLNEAVYDGKATFQYRSLTKFNICAFLTNIPEGGHYIGFGPNDSLCNIHRPNESINKKLLAEHENTFKRFLRWAYQTTFK